MILAERIAWSGRLDEVAFLSRLYNLQELPSYDSGFRTAERDIIEHNYDWHNVVEGLEEALHQGCGELAQAGSLQATQQRGLALRSRRLTSGLA